MKHLFRKIKNIYLQLKERDIILSPDCHVTNTLFDGKNRIGKNTFLAASFIGRGTYIGSCCHFSHISVGRYCSFGNNIRIIVGSHPSTDWVSTHPAFFSTAKQAGFTYVTEDLYEEKKYIDEEKKYYVIIGNDVWIGDGASIVAGIRIGDGAIIGANALVTKDVEPYTIVGGVPAKPIRKRFEQHEIDFLLAFKWWDKDEHWIEEHASYFFDIKRFAAHMNSELTGE